MSEPTLDVDVAVAGASLAGCTAAILLGRAGARVALIEKHGDEHAYKRLCGHYIQSSATPVLDRLGLIEPIERAGGVRNGVDLETPWGWIRPRGAPTHGYSLRREKLDPLIRGAARETPGVTYLGGQAVTALEAGERRGGAVLSVRDRRDAERRIGARVVVGADGRHSTVAKLAGAKERRHPNHRFCYMAYYEGAEPGADGRGTLWMLPPDVLIAAPNDEGLTLFAAFVHKDRLPAFKADRTAAFEARFGRRLGDARRVSPLIGYVDYPAIARPPVPAPAVALVGDAALTCDPTLAIGCGWALQSASWLADALIAGEPLRRYATRHRKRLAGHARMLDRGARALPPNLVERLMLGAATRDPALARHLERYTSREIRVRTFLAPTAIARAARAAAR
jgi:menaquinone-9 beta-reductase